VSVNYTVRIPKELAKKMRKYREINWSEVIRKSIEDYIRRLEETKVIETNEEILERLSELGISKEDLVEYDIEEERRIYREMVKKEWKRVKSTIQVQ